MRSRRALVMSGPRAASLRDEPLGDVRPDEVVVRSEFSSFKHGTELAAYLGTSPFRGRRFDPELRVFTDVPGGGDAPGFYPRPLGNMTAGAVEEAGRAVRWPAVGEPVFGWLPVADRHRCDPAMLRPLGGLTPEQALCVDPASFALGAVIDGDVRAGESVLITGLGAIGLLAVRYCKLRGATVIAASSFALRRELAGRMGADRVLGRGEGDDLGLDVKGITRGGVDAAIECSGHYRQLRHAIRATRQCGRVVCVGFYSGDAGELRLSEEFFHNRITMLASLPAYSWHNPVRSDPPLYAKDLQDMAIGDLLAGRLAVEGLLRPRIAFERSAGALEMVCDRPEGVVKVLVTHGDRE